MSLALLVPHLLGHLHKAKFTSWQPGNYSLKESSYQLLVKNFDWTNDMHEIILKSSKDWFIQDSVDSWKYVHAPQCIGKQTANCRHLRLNENDTASHLLHRNCATLLYIIVRVFLHKGPYFQQWLIICNEQGHFVITQEQGFQRNKGRSIYFGPSLHKHNLNRFVSTTSKIHLHPQLHCYILNTVVFKRHMVEHGFALKIDNAKQDDTSSIWCHKISALWLAYHSCGCLAGSAMPSGMAALLFHGC